VPLQWRRWRWRRCRRATRCHAGVMWATRRLAACLKGTEADATRYWQGDRTIGYLALGGQQSARCTFRTRASEWSEPRALWLRTRSSSQRRPPHGKRRLISCQRTQRCAASHVPTATPATPCRSHLSTSQRHLAASPRHASTRLMASSTTVPSRRLISPRLTSPHRLALRTAVAGRPADARSTTIIIACCHRRPDLRGRARSRQRTASWLGNGGSSVGCAHRRNPSRGG